MITIYKSNFPSNEDIPKKRNPIPPNRDLGRKGGPGRKPTPNGEGRVKFWEKFKNNLIDLFKEEDELLNK